jgi:hypothetical protein
VRRLRWERYPKIGFWLDNDPLRFYHSANDLDFQKIQNHGLSFPHGWVILNLEPYSLEQEYVLVIDLPLRWMYHHMDQRFTNMKEIQKNRLLRKELYIKWKRFDYQYYYGLQIRISNIVPARYVTGVMRALS